MNIQDQMKVRRPKKTYAPFVEALFIALPYFILGCLWIFFSDLLLELTDDPSGMIMISNLKGWFYVAITAVLLWILVYSRIKQLKTYQAHLETSEAHFRLLVEAAPDAVFVQTESRFAYVNQKTVDLFGAKSESDLLGVYIPDRVSAISRGKVIDNIKLLNNTQQAAPTQYETIIRMNGEYLDVEVSATPIEYDQKRGALVFMRDISPRKELERTQQELEMKLQQKQKLEAIGTLAGGVAHEINNPVSGIINYAQLIAEDPAANALLVEYSREIITEGLRVAEIVKDLLSFARQEKHTYRPETVKDIIDHTLSLIRSVIRHDQIEFTVDIPENLPLVLCNIQQIQQVLMNIITNARDALNSKYPDGDLNKKIVVSCSAFEKDGREWIRLQVEDHGTGIPDDIIGKILDPFFTTKPVGEGTGLGLSISHGIIHEHHGELYFETEPGLFTKAIIELPAQ